MMHLSSQPDTTRTRGPGGGAAPADAVPPGSAASATPAASADSVTSAVSAALTATPGRLCLWPRHARRRRRSAGGRLPASRTMFASGLALSLCTFAACALTVPGLVLGAAPEAGSNATTPATVAGIAQAADATDQDSKTAAGPASDAAAKTTAATTTQPSLSSGTLLVTLPWGEGAGQVGLTWPAEGLSRGPEAVAVAPDGRIAILDSVNHRLVLLSADGTFQSTVPVPLAEPRFLAVTDDRLHVLDADHDRRLITLDWSGQDLESLELPESADVVTGLFATDRGPAIEVAHGPAYLLSGEATKNGVEATIRDLPSRPLRRDLGRTAAATFAPGKGLQIAVSSLDRRSLKTSERRDMSPDLAPGRAIEHLVSVDGDGDGGLIVGARLLSRSQANNSAGINGGTACAEPALVVARVGLGDIGRGPSAGTSAPASAAATPAAGDVAATAAAPGAGDAIYLSDCTFAYLGQPYVITPNGLVIQPVADEDGYGLMVHVFAATDDGGEVGQ